MELWHCPHSKRINSLLKEEAQIAITHTAYCKILCKAMSVHSSKASENHSHVHADTATCLYHRESIFFEGSWVLCMSRRRICPQTRPMGQIQLNNMSPGVVGTSWLPTALETLQKLKQWTLLSCLIWPRNERETLTTRGWSHCACSFCTKDSYIQGLTYSSFSFSRYESGCTCFGSFVTLKTNTFPTTFNLQSWNRYRGLLCPLCWPWPLQDDVKTGEHWEKKMGQIPASGINEQITFQTPLKNVIKLSQNIWTFTLNRSCKSHFNPKLCSFFKR